MIAEYLIKQAIGQYVTDASGGYFPTTRGTTPYDSQRVSTIKQKANAGVTDRQEQRYQTDNLKNTMDAVTYGVPAAFGGSAAVAGVRAATRALPKVWGATKGFVRGALKGMDKTKYPDAIQAGYEM